jgi:hypothetical protein
METIETNDIIASQGSSGTVGVGVGFGEGEVEVSGMVMVCVLLQSLI